MRTKNPVKFDHKIQAAALSSTHDYLFLQDELGKIALLGLNKDGEIEARFIGLPTLGTDKTLVSGTMLNDGRFISSLGESTIALIDLGLTLQKEEWQIKTFEVTDAYAMTWFAEIPGGVGQVLIKDSGRIILLDYEAGSIIDEVSIAQMHDIRGSRLGIPHLMATDQLQNENAATGSYHLYYVQNGKISHQILTNVRSSFSSTYLDKERFRLIIAAEERDDDGSSRKQKKETKFKGDVFRFDLKNGSKVEKVTLKNQNRVALTDQFVIQYLDSALGWAKRFKYSDSDSDIFTELKFFNLDLLREKYD